ncbi:MAG: DciA family protein [Candidatus Pelagibacter bacterium]|jgi:hypothetical protein|nr:DciA family protein [Candidatus Pelagibacter bacterium]|tara:strand:- start:90 stop:572 length:483 start_codon:yes stop_codon:yes gene_type:complete
MEFKYNTKQRNKTIQGLRSFKDTLPKNIKRIINKKGYIYSETLNNWKYIVEDELFKVCYPKSFKNSNRLGKSCLNIMIKRGHEVDMEYSKKLIIDKMNTFFGYNVVEKIKLITFEGEQEKLKENYNKDVTKNEYIEKISSIKNDKVKNSLIELSKLFKKR